MSIKKHKKHFRFSSGFTLVELLVVIAIIGILATLLLSQLGIARAKARDAARVAHITQVSEALELYFDDKGQYPQTTTLSVLATDGYLKRLPVDPLTSGCSATIYDGAAGCYGYAYKDKNKYHIWAELERTSQALNGDSDFNSTAASYTGSTKDGAPQTCADPSLAVVDCIFDLGQTQ